MISVLASIKVKDDRLNAFLQIFKANVPNVMREDGCAEYRPMIDLPTDMEPQVQDKNVVTIIEKWESLEHLIRHLQTPHMMAYKEKTKALVDSVSLKVLQDA